MKKTIFNSYCFVLVCVGLLLASTYSFGQTNSSISNFDVDISANQSCGSPYSITLIKPDSFYIDIVIDSLVKCNGDSNASLSYTSSGGMSPYNVSWNVVDHTAVSAGVYTVTLTDNNGCSVTSSIVVDEPDVLSVVPSVVDVSCFNGSDGVVSALGFGGVAPYIFDWGGIDTSNLSVGVYTVTISDSNLCTATSSFQISEPIELNPTLFVIDSIDCYGASSGVVGLNVVGGVSPYSFDWGGVDSSMLSAGTYTVTIVDANNCISTSSIMMTQPDDLIVSVSILDSISCFGFNDANLLPTSIGGTLPYNYSWNVGDGNSLYSGTYTVTVTDGNNCLNTTSVVITQPTELQISLSSDDVLCNGDATGKLFSSQSGGTPSYDLNWSTIDTASVIVGIYSVTLTDINNCVLIDSVEVNEPFALSDDIDIVPNTCSTVNNGKIEVTSTGGTVPYTYEWTNGIDTSALAFGVYSLTVTDGNGCFNVYDSLLVEEKPLQVEPVALIPCQDTLFNIDAVAYNGSPSYTYLWNTGSTNQDLFDVPAGMYTVTVTDAIGCTSVSNLEIAPSPVAVSEICNNGIDDDGDGWIDCYDNECLTINQGGSCPNRFACDARLFQTLNVNDDMWLYEVGLDGTFTPLVNLDDQGLTNSINSIGLNPLDGYIYGINPQSPQTLWRIDADYNLYNLGNISGFGSGGFYAGDIDLNGKYYVAGNNQYYEIDIQNQTANLIGSNSTGPDLTINPDDGVIYSILSNGDLITIDPNTFDVTTIGDTGIPNGANGAQYFTGLGDMLAYDNDTGDLYNVNTTTAASNVVTTGPSVSLNDGCSCIFKLDFMKEPSTKVHKEGDLFSYTFTLFNNSGITFNDVKFTDVLRDGLVWASEPYDVSPSLTLGPTSVTGSVIANIDIIDMPLDTTRFTIDVQVPNTFKGANQYNNQAFISNLPAFAGCTKVSDDPSTGVENDSTAVIICPGLVSIDSLLPNIPIRCSGGSLNLSAEITANSTLTYEWTRPNGVKGFNPTFNANQDGYYSLIIRDTFGCESIDSVLVTSADPIIATSIIEPVSCNGGDDGKVLSISPTGGFGDYSYVWGALDSASLSRGNYSVGIVDSNGCTGSHNFSVTQPTVLNTNLTYMAPSCHDAFDGVVIPSASGGVGPYSYSWDVLDTAALEVGIYTVTTTDANFCSTTASVEIFAPNPLQIGAVVEDVKCQGANTGSIVLSGVGGTPNYNYTWHDGYSQASRLNIVSGTYSITLSDNNGCSVDTTLIVEAAPVNFTVTALPQNPLCADSLSGSIDIEVSPGGPSFSYLWSDNSVNEDLANVGSGAYTVTITKPNSCAVVSQFNLVDPTPVTIIPSSIITSPVSCNGGSDGSYALEVTGGTPSYSFDWGGEDTTALSQGVYVVTISDQNGCLLTNEFTITQPAALATSMSSTPVSCFGGADGTATVITNGGVAPYTYDWGSFDNVALLEGQYFVTVTDANNCSIVDSVEVNSPDSLIVSIALDNAISCSNGSDGSVNVSSVGGNGGYSYDWGGVNPTQLSVGVYTVTVADSKSCAATTSIELVEPSALELNLVVEHNVSCYGGNDGVVSATLSGGTMPYNVNWGGLDTMQLSEGNYTVTLSDDEGCTIEQSFEITQPNALTVNASANQQVSCYGGSNGVISAVGNGGVTPYSYTWSTVDTTAVAVGTYTVTLIDANNCESIDIVEVTSPDSLIVEGAVSAVSCYGGADGQIVLTTTGGVSPYVYDWGGNNPNSLTEGVYSVTVMDANNCVLSASYVVTQPTVLEVVTTSIDATIYGVADGSATANASGGTGPYSYDWGGYDNTALLAGEYTVTVTDANNCTTTAAVIIDQPNSLGVSLITTPVLCNGGATGTVQSTPIGGVAPYTYVWSNPNVNNLTIGTYGVTITDAAGAVADTMFTITEPLALSLLPISNDVKCYGTPTGSIDVDINGGVAPYTKSWSVINPSSVNSGVYTVTVTDANGCLVDTEVVVIEPDSVVTLVSTIDVLCNGGSSGQAIAVTSGGIEPYVYIWSDGSAYGLSKGSYTVTVVDANNCINEQVFAVNEPTELVANSTTIDALCYGSSDGVLNGNAIGGVGPYDYTWLFGLGISQDSLITTAPAGTYTVTVSDANECSSVQAVTVGQPDSLSVNVITSPVSCFGDNDGNVTVSIYGGIQPYVNIWSGLDSSALVAGDYILNAIDVNNCPVSTAFTINSPEKLEVTLDVENANCGQATGNIVTTTTGGNDGHVFDWSINGSGLYNDPKDLFNIGLGVYTVSVVDENNCFTSVSGEILNDVSPPGGVLFAANPVLGCTKNNPLKLVGYGQSNSLTPWVKDFSYQWGNGVEDQFNFVNQPGVYTVTITDNVNNCTTIAVNEVFPPDPVAFSIIDTIDPSCNRLNQGNHEDGYIVMTIHGEKPNSHYTFEAEGFDYDGEEIYVDHDLWQLDTVLTYLSEGNYTITMTEVSTGCIATQEVALIEPEPLNVDITLFNTQIEATKNYVLLGQGFSAKAHGEDLSGKSLNPDKYEVTGYDYWWTVSDNEIVQGNGTPNVANLPSLSATYEVLVTEHAKGEAGGSCTAIESVRVHVKKDRNVFTPNVFTPNGDGANDFFGIHTGAGVVEVRNLKVFDRWGEVVYAHDLEVTSGVSNIAGNWDGKFLGEDALAGVYVYFFEVLYLDGDRHFVKGDVTLTR